MQNLVKNCTIILTIFTLLFSTTTSVVSQTQQLAQVEIQEAEDKLGEVIILLEKASRDNIEIRDLIIITDNARSLISLAKEKYNEANFSIAYDYANEANVDLDVVEEEIEMRNGINKQNLTLLISLLSVFSVLLIGLTVFVIIKWGYPWYTRKQRQEYGELEIQYEEENEGVKHD